MPNLDNTGPEGNGPTGYGLGSCPNKANTVMNRAGGGRAIGCERGFGRRGHGRRCNSGNGFGRSFNFSKKDEMIFLKEEIKSTEEQLALMKNRLDEIDIKDS
jgi:hypothetical protein